MIFLACTVLCFFHVYVLQPTSALCQDHILDYYWRDYVGIIPEDAIPGGKDRSGSPTYIGQVYIKDGELLPATIYPGCRRARTSAYRKELETNENIKILCGKYLDKYKWKITKTDETHLLTNCHLVIGGYEMGNSLNFGRVNYDEQIIVGKISSNPLPLGGLWIPFSGHEAQFFTYEILTYGC